jgi:hypothetical protein
MKTLSEETLKGLSGWCCVWGYTEKYDALEEITDKITSLVDKLALSTTKGAEEIIAEITTELTKLDTAELPQNKCYPK